MEGGSDARWMRLRWMGWRVDAVAINFDVDL